jgi:carboxymethylenebutenolidase
MTRTLCVLCVAAVLGAACNKSSSPTATEPAAGAPAAAPAAPPSAPLTTAAAVDLPADAERAKEALAASPRHGEWVDVKLPDGGKLLTWVVYPETGGKAGAVLVIHEIFGLTDWARGVADALAARGFVALAPDLLSGMGPGGGGTASLGDGVGATIRTLTPEMVATRLDAVRAYALTLPAVNGKVGSVGFCWGGSASFNYAVAQPKLDAAVVYYGTAPADTAAYAKIGAPVLGLYGSDDARVNATIPTAQAEMQKAGKRYEAKIFDGAGHGFLRQLTGRDGANRKAAEQAWPQTVSFFQEHLK